MVVCLLLRGSRGGCVQIVALPQRVVINVVRFYIAHGDDCRGTHAIIIRSRNDAALRKRLGCDAEKMYGILVENMCAKRKRKGRKYTIYMIPVMLSFHS